MYTSEQIEKIGNTVVYLASKIQNISKTKLLKLIYILDEISIKQSGIPFLNLQYKVWKFGPVSNELFVEFSSRPSILKKFIERKTTKDGHDFIAPKTEFCEDEFSQNDLDLLEFVVERFQGYNAEKLIAYTHRENSPWYNAAKKNNVLQQLESEEIGMTEIIIDMSELVAHDSRKTELYKDFIEC